IPTRRASMPAAVRERVLTRVTRPTNNPRRFPKGTRAETAGGFVFSRSSRASSPSSTRGQTLAHLAMVGLLGLLLPGLAGWARRRGLAGPRALGWLLAVALGVLAAGLVVRAAWEGDHLALGLGGAALLALALGGRTTFGRGASRLAFAAGVAVLAAA